MLRVIVITCVICFLLLALMVVAVAVAAADYDRYQDEAADYCDDVYYEDRKHSGLLEDDEYD